MKEAVRDHFEKRLARLRAENQGLRQDLSSLRGKNEELRKALRNRDDLFHSYPAGLIIVQEGKIADVNMVALNRLGYAREEVIGRSFLDVVHPDSKAFVGGIQKKTPGKGAPKRHEVDLVTQAGDTYRCDLRVKKIRYNGRTAFLGRFCRLEKRKRRENELIESRKMEALATMASGLALRFGSSLKGIAEQTRKLKGAGSLRTGAVREGLEKIETATAQMVRVARILDHLSGHDRDQTALVPLDLNGIVKDAVSSAEKRLEGAATGGPPRIHVRTYLRSISPVQGSPEEMSEMIEHLLRNAVEAMPGGGDLYVSTEESAGYAHVYIQDSGAGIPEDIQRRVFDPFFSTRGDHALGLGLSLCSAVARKHHGTIEIDSKRDRGTIVTVRVPLATEERPPRNKSRKGRIKGRHILIIEDDDMIRALLSQLLSSKGFKVASAGSAAEGLNEVKKKAFDMVIADSDPPDAEGRFLVREIRKTRRELPIALITEEEGEIPLPSGGGAVDLRITKPIDMTKVVTQITEVLTTRVRRG